MKKLIACIFFLAVMPTAVLANSVWDCTVSLKVELDTLRNRYNPSGAEPDEPLATRTFSKAYTIRVDNYSSPYLDINLSFINNLYKDNLNNSEFVEHSGDEKYSAVLQNGLNLDYNKDLNARVIVRADQTQITNIDILTSYRISQNSTSSHGKYTNTNVAHDIVPYSAITVWRDDPEFGKRGEIYQIFPEVLVRCKKR